MSLNDIEFQRCLGVQLMSQKKLFEKNAVIASVSKKARAKKLDTAEAKKGPIYPRSGWFQRQQNFSVPLVTNLNRKTTEKSKTNSSLLIRQSIEQTNYTFIHSLHIDYFSHLPGLFMWDNSKLHYKSVKDSSLKEINESVLQGDEDEVGTVPRPPAGEKGLTSTRRHCDIRQVTGAWTKSMLLDRGADNLLSWQAFSARGGLWDASWRGHGQVDSRRHSRRRSQFKWHLSAFWWSTEWVFRSDRRSV